VIHAAFAFTELTHHTGHCSNRLPLASGMKDTNTGIIDYDPNSSADKRIVLIHFGINCFYQLKLVRGILLNHYEIADDDFKRGLEPGVLLISRAARAGKEIVQHGSESWYQRIRAHWT
jgi:hypothetical protein